MVSGSLILAIVLLVGIISSIFLILFLNRNNALKNTDPISVNPVEINQKVNCKQERTPCDPADPNSCAHSCNETELKCLNLDSITPSTFGKQINGGGFVCLPEIPEITCNLQNGGVYVWSGWGFTEEQNWDCFCSYPEYFGSSGCQTPNPDLCSGGTIDYSQLENGKSAPTSEICKCPPGTMLLLRGGTNTPYCESTDPKKGGGEFGLVGTLHPSPDWRNILFRRVISSQFGIDLETTSVWADRIARQLTSSYKPGDPATKNLVSNLADMLDGFQKTCPDCNVWGTECMNYCSSFSGKMMLSKIDKNIANNICQIICPNVCSGICDCGTNTASWNSEIEAAGKHASYTYDPEDQTPPKVCV
jgi:hypothetical protein